jgi:disulfide bond formation protein DsbB
MALVESVIWVLGTLTLVADSFLVCFLAALIFPGKATRQVFRFLGRNSVLLAFIVSATATLGSLFFSEIAGFVPCHLCWFQRIFMYPVALISLAALLTKRDPFPFIFPLVSTGLLVSAYHNWLMFSAAPICGPESCTTQFFTLYGYITIPVMALTAFLLILSFGLSGRWTRRR